MFFVLVHLGVCFQFGNISTQSMEEIGNTDHSAVVFEHLRNQTILAEEDFFARYRIWEKHDKLDDIATYIIIVMNDQDRKDENLSSISYIDIYLLLSYIQPLLLVILVPTVELFYRCIRTSKRELSPRNLLPLVE